PASYSPFLFEPQTHEDDPNPQPVVDFVQAINATSDADFVKEVSRYLNPRLYLTHAAIESVVAEIDGIVGGVYGMNNFDLYRFEGQKLSQLLVWDKDLSFAYPERGLLDGVDNNILMRRLLALPEYRSTYLTAVMRALGLLGGEGGWADGEITRLYGL